MVWVITLAGVWLGVAMISWVAYREGKAQGQMQANEDLVERLAEIRAEASERAVDLVAQARAEATARTADLLEEVRGGRPVRYEVQIADFGAEYESMRYRWNIWDADRLLLVETRPDLAEEVGISTPFMLGNAATRLEAEAQAMDWLDQHAVTGDSLVVSA